MRNSKKKKINYFDKIRNITTSVASEIKEELSRIGRSFTNDDDEPLEFFSYKEAEELDIVSINSDGTITFVGGQLGYTLPISSLLDDDTINIYNAISLLDELREIKK